MENYSPKRTVIGFLDNLSYDGADVLAEKHHLESRLMRRHMVETIEELFSSTGVHYIGNNVDRQYPFGGFFFKTSVPQTEKDLRKFTLEKLRIDDSLKLPFGYKDTDISLGLLLMEFPNDENPGQISWTEDNVLNLAKHVAAFYRHRLESRNEKNEPYLFEVNDEFKQKFPVDKTLDSD